MKKIGKIRSSRSGALLIAVLVCFGVVALILLATVTSSLAERRQLKRELQMRQTQLLADAGVEMAIRTADQSGDRENEGGDKEQTWQQATVELVDFETAIVKWRFGEKQDLEVVATIGERPTQKTTYEIRLRAQEWNPEKEN